MPERECITLNLAQMRPAFFEGGQAHRPLLRRARGRVRLKEPPDRLERAERPRDLRERLHLALGTQRVGMAVGEAVAEKR